jgi:hypothetical protein
MGLKLFDLFSRLMIYSSGSSIQTVIAGAAANPCFWRAADYIYLEVK